MTWALSSGFVRPKATCRSFTKTLVFQLDAIFRTANHPVAKILALGGVDRGENVLQSEGESPRAATPSQPPWPRRGRRPNGRSSRKAARDGKRPTTRGVASRI